MTIRDMACRITFMIKYPKLIKTATEKLANVREDVKARDKELIENSIKTQGDEKE